MRRRGWISSLDTRCLVAVFSLSAAACSSVTTLEPVGAIPVELAPAGWNGRWCNPANGLPGVLPAPAAPGPAQQSAAGAARAQPTGAMGPATTSPAPPTAPPGAAPVGKSPDPQECLQFQVSNEVAGELQVVDLEDGDRYPAYVRTDDSRNVMFITVRDENTQLLWVRAVKDRDLIVAWLPEAAAFKKLVESGALPGTVKPGDSGDVTLAALGPAHRALLAADANRMLFNWPDPMVFVRVRPE